MDDASPLRTLIADDHALVRSGIVALLEDIPGVTVVGEADDGDQLLQLVERLQPALVITDISMPGLSGLDVLRSLQAREPRPKVLILSMYDSPAYVRQAIADGAAGYILKSAATVELHLAVQSVRANQTYLSPRIATRLMEQLEGAGTPAAPAPGPRAAAALTPRQVEVLRLISDGKALKEIAHELGLSVKTVETHRSMIMDRLGVRDTASLVHYALHHGIAPLREPPQRP